jgi:DNA-binding NarL/FixJ family response regulator
VAVQVAIFCYNLLLGEALKRLISGDKEINIIGMFGNGMGFNEVSKLKPDVLLLDMETYQAMPEDLPADWKSKLLLVGSRWSNSAPPEWFDDFISKGGVGILPATADLHTLKKALNVVSRGELWLDRKSMSQILSRQAEGRKGSSQLSETEKEVAALICLGYRNKEIALKLGVSENTVKSHLNRIYKKLEVSDRLQLAIKLGRNLLLQDHLNRLRH